MASVLPVLIFLVVALGLMTVAALFTPKGPNQVYVASLDHGNSASSPVLQCHKDRVDAHYRIVLPHVDDHIHGSATPVNWCVLDSNGKSVQALTHVRLIAPHSSKLGH